MIFWMGNSFCKNILKIKNQKNDSRKNLLNFFPMAPHKQFFFQQFFAVLNLFAQTFPPSLKKKIMVHP